MLLRERIKRDQVWALLLFLVWWSWIYLTVLFFKFVTIIIFNLLTMVTCSTDTQRHKPCKTHLPVRPESTKKLREECREDAFHFFKATPGWLWVNHHNRTLNEAQKSICFQDDHISWKLEVACLPDDREGETMMKPIRRWEHNSSRDRNQLTNKKPVRGDFNLPGRS